MRWVLTLFFVLVLVPTMVCEPAAISATLVEVHAIPKCAGFDCPPWPVPDDLSFCFEADGKFFTGVYRPWGFPWNEKREKLLALLGKQVLIVPTERRIRIAISAHNLRLKRVHNDPVFNLPTCAHD
jgi:hypothetical protein